MEFRELIKERRSVRKYQKCIIPAEDVREILQMASYAPSWKNNEASRSYVAVSEEAVQAVYEALPSFNQRSTENAVYVVTAYVKGQSGFGPEGPVDHLGDKWGVYDAGLHNAYFVLAAKEKGYDTLILGLRDEEKLRAVFNIPEEEEILSVIALGKREGDVKTAARKEVEDFAVIR